jgi:ABC-type dipeptide/oligopeptide/nickel transport system permease component
MSQTTTRTSSTTRRSPSAALLVGTAIALSTGVQLVVFGIGLFVASDEDINREQGVKASLVSIAVVAAACLAIGFAIALASRRAGRSGTGGAIALGALSVVSIPIFWAGGPAIFGSLAAWLGGLTKEGRPQTGAARTFGVVGLVLAVLNVVAVLVLTLGSVATNGYSG